MFKVEKIVLIGPALPFRGGIAQHTTMLKRALAKKNEVLLLSFSRQYPVWLFPGESDRDPAYKNYKEAQTEYVIDSINPLTWIKSVKRVVSFNATMVIIPWWTVFWTPCFGYISGALKRKNIEVVFFCHNVVEHEAAAWKSFLTKNVLKNASRFVVHTKEDKANLERLIPNAEIVVHPHPIYNHFPKAKGILARRKSLELLFYGFIRPYKGLDDLIDVMALLKGQDIQLTIAGEFWSGKEETLNKIKSIGLEEQIELRSRYHSDQETAELFNRSDIVVLPYRSATGSGIVPIAYHYNKPVIVTNVGGLPDVVKDGETGFIVEKHDVSAIASCITDFQKMLEKDWTASIGKIKKVLSWSSLAGVIVSRGKQN